jgi:hypothetical protein
MIVMMVTQPGPLALVDVYRPFGAGSGSFLDSKPGPLALVDAYRPFGAGSGSFLDSKPGPLALVDAYRPFGALNLFRSVTRPEGPLYVSPDHRAGSYEPPSIA